jgi:hypothetical protein
VEHASISRDRVVSADRQGVSATAGRAAVSPGVAPVNPRAALALARAIGNRGMGRLLQRHGGQALTNPATASTTSRSDPRFRAVDSDLTFSKWGWEAMGIMDRLGVSLVLADRGAPASFLPDYNRCVINLSAPSYEVAAYFVHEMHHAAQFHAGRSPKATTMAKDPWVRTMVTEEIDGTVKGFLHKLALEQFGRAPENDVGMNYFRGAYRHGLKKAHEQGLEGVEAGDAARANARQAVVWMMEPRGGTQPVLGPNQFDSYAQYYGREWVRENRPVAQPAGAP